MFGVTGNPSGVPSCGFQRGLDLIRAVVEMVEIVVQNPLAGLQSFCEVSSGHAGVMNSLDRGFVVSSGVGCGMRVADEVRRLNFMVGICRANGLYDGAPYRLAGVGGLAAAGQFSG